MASESSMDIVVKFEFQELKNAIEMAKKDATNRYDLKDSKIEIELNENDIKVTTETENQIESVYGIILQKMISRSLSPKILDRQKIQEIGGMRVKQEMKLHKVLDQENAKKITKIIRDEFPKVKAAVQGDTVRVSSKSRDDLQAVISRLRGDESFNVPLDFTNYR